MKSGYSLNYYFLLQTDSSGGKNHTDKEAKDNTDWTPLHLAAHDGHLETIKFLVESGANKDARSTFGLLVESGASKEAFTIRGRIC